MGDRHRLAGCKHDEVRGVLHLRCVVEVLDAHTSEGRAGAVAGGDDECVGGEGMQSAAGVVEELEGLVSGVGEDGDDLEFLDTVDDIGAGDLEGEARCSGDSRCRDSDSEEGSAK